jgi:hypothetical protein
MSAKYHMRHWPVGARDDEVAPSKWRRRILRRFVRQGGSQLRTETLQRAPQRKCIEA